MNGLQAHSSTHPGTLCEADSQHLSTPGSLKTFGSIRKSFRDFESGLDLKKFYKNVIHMPFTDLPDQTFFFDLLPPMELHLMLGVVNHLFKALRDIWLKADDWLILLRI